APWAPTPRSVQDVRTVCSVVRRRDECPGLADGGLGGWSSGPLRRPRAVLACDRQRARDDRRSSHPLRRAGPLSVEDPPGRARHRAADRWAGAPGGPTQRRPQRDAGRIEGHRRQSGRVDRVRVPAAAAMSSSVIPGAVYVIWWIGLIVT